VPTQPPIQWALGALSLQVNRPRRLTDLVCSGDETYPILQCIVYGQKLSNSASWRSMLQQSILLWLCKDIGPKLFFSFDATKQRAKSMSPQYELQEKPMKLFTKWLNLSRKQWPKHYECPPEVVQTVPSTEAASEIPNVYQLIGAGVAQYVLRRVTGWMVWVRLLAGARTFLSVHHIIKTAPHTTFLQNGGEAAGTWSWPLTSI
jgi:hypothetical protein